MRISVVIALMVSLLMSAASLAESSTHKYLNDLRKQKEQAAEALNQTIRVAQSKAVRFDVAADFKSRVVVYLEETNVSFLSETLEKDCFVQAIAQGAVGGSALSEDILLCHISKIKQRDAELRLLFEI